MASRTRFDDVAAPADGLEWCHEAVQGVSRTFALTIRVLEEPMASYICLGYLLCRIPDTIEDAAHIPPEAQIELLRAYDRVLDPTADYPISRFREQLEPWLPPVEERTADWRVVANTDVVLETFRAFPADVRRAMRDPARELVTGMADFVERYAEDGGLRIRTADELEEYCYYAAGTVGRLITNLVCRPEMEQPTERRLYATAESFGLLLQFVNVAKDVYVDFTEENNVYLPRAWFREEDVSPEEIDDPENADEVAGVVARTANYARRFLDDAQHYLETVPEREGNRLAAWAIPYLLAVGTLRELRDRPEDAVSENGVKVTREEVEAIVAATAGREDHPPIEELRNRVAESPFRLEDA